MSLRIPLVAIPAQTLRVTLANQPTRITLRYTAYGLFMDLYVIDVLIIGGVICQDRNRIVRNTYLGFIGDLAFYDLQGTEDPQPSGLGTRWVLVYLEAAA